MYKKKPLFIVFEGIEGSGKSYLSKFLSMNKKITPQKPIIIPMDFKNFIFSFLVKKCAKPAAVNGVLAIKIAAKLL